MFEESFAIGIRAFFDYAHTHTLTEGGFGGCGGGFRSGITTLQFKAG